MDLFSKKSMVVAYGQKVIYILLTSNDGRQPHCNQQDKRATIAKIVPYR